MIKSFYLRDNKLMPDELHFDQQQEQPLWIDLHNPTPEERLSVEDIVGMPLPHMEHIQKPQQLMNLSQGCFTMMSPMMSTEGKGHLVHVLFVMTQKHLVTLHMQPWECAVPSQVLDQDHSPLSLLYHLLYQSVTQVGQALEYCQERFDTISKNLFVFTPQQTPQKQENMNLLTFNTVIGQYANLITALEDHLEGLQRCVNFFDHKGFPTEKEAIKDLFYQLDQEIRSTLGLATALTKSAGFLQDATVSHIAMNQNENIELLTKIVAFLTPPLLFFAIVELFSKEPSSIEMIIKNSITVLIGFLSSVITYYMFKRS